MAVAYDAEVEYLESKGYSSIMWNYDTAGGTEELSENIAWNVCGMGKDDKLIREELKRGRKMINTKCYPYYFDFPYGWNTLKMVCNDDGALTEDDEETFGIELDETDMNPFELTTVQSVINMVSKYCGGDENE